MQSFTNTPKFQQWLNDLATMPSTSVAESLFANTPQGRARLANLTEYFRRMEARSPKVVLIGEAPGYQGTRRTGVPFASEHIVNGGMPEVSFFGDTSGFSQVFVGDREYKEPTSTIMWRTISKCRELPLLWSAYPLHPHKAGILESNRTPTRAEVATAKDHLVAFLEITGVETVLSLGNTAKLVLDDLGVESQKLRHPGHGGGPLFAKQLHDILS